MKQNVITNVEPVIRKALTLTGRQLQSLREPVITPIERKKPDTRINPLESERENTARAKKLQRIFVPPPPKPRLNRPHITETQKSASPPETNLSMDSLKSSSSNNSPFTSTLQTIKRVPSSSS
ncbi:unnamed protein product, partial [Rotaria magnacalcarata]